MPQYKLTYYDIGGRAEVARILFSLAGVKFEDFKFPQGGEEWKAIKATTPFGQIPTLEVDGQVICQSHVIEEYLAREFGYAGKTNWDQARAGMVTHCVEDMLQPGISAYHEPDDDKKKEKIKKVQEQVYDHLNKLQTLLISNKEGGGYFVGDSLTYADLVFYHLMSAVEFFASMKIDWNKFSKLKDLRNRIELHPKVAEYYQRNPPKKL